MADQSAFSFQFRQHSFYLPLSQVKKSSQFSGAKSLLLSEQLQQLFFRGFAICTDIYPDICTDICTDILSFVLGLCNLSESFTDHPQHKFNKNGRLSCIVCHLKNSIVFFLMFVDHRLNRKPRKYRLPLLKK